MLSTGKGGSLILPLIIIILLAATIPLGIWERAEGNIYNSWFKLRGVEPPGDEIVVVAIDDRSIRELGETYPWPRHIHAELLSRINEAGIVAFDVVFDLPGAPDSDAAFAAAIENHGRVVLASAFTLTQSMEGWEQELIQPLPVFLAECDAMGFINMPEDLDNVVRRATVLDTNYFDRAYPSFALAIAALAVGADPYDLELTSSGVKWAGDRVTPLQGPHQVLVNYFGPAGTFTTVSYIDVLSGSIPPSFWTNKIVLIGPYSALAQDVFQTPFTRGNMVLHGSPPVPGVEVNASVVKTHLDGSYIRRAGTGLNVLVFVVITCLCLVLIRRGNPWLGLAVTLLLAAVATGLAAALWFNSRYWLDLAAPLAGLALVYTVVTAENFVRTEMERRRTRSMFGRYVSPVVVEQLMSQPGLANLGGSRQEVTIMFCDIRGFTSFSESRSPEEVVARLNIYLTVLTREVFRYGGTLDKYLGDGLMAIFGAPIPHPDHSSRALAAAQDMHRAVARENEITPDQQPLHIGIGLSTGPVLVGNVGSPERMEYTVIGGEVNLASRVESMNKEMKTDILFSDRTYRHLQATGTPADGRIIPLGEVAIRGLKEKIDIFTILPSEKDSKSNGE